MGICLRVSEFQPSRRDAEAVMLLTLRIVEWFLGEGNMHGK